MTLPPTVPGSGTSAYTQTAATPPTRHDGSVAPGFTTISAVASFSDKKVALTLQVTVGVATYTLATRGGTATPSSSELILGTSGDFASTLVVRPYNGICTTSTSGCMVYVRGTLAGASVERMAVTFVISNDGNGGHGIHGVAVLTKQ